MIAIYARSAGHGNTAWCDRQIEACLVRMASDGLHPHAIAGARAFQDVGWDGELVGPELGNLFRIAAWGQSKGKEPGWLTLYTALPTTLGYLHRMVHDEFTKCGVKIVYALFNQEQAR